MPIEPLTGRTGPLCNVPGEMTTLNQWVAWRNELREGAAKPTKVPYMAMQPNRRASSTGPGTWCSFFIAAKQYARIPDLAGVGFVLREGGGLLGLDLDDSLDADGRLLPWAREVFDRVGAAHTYGEISPGLRGVKVIGRGDLPHDPVTGEVGKGRNRRRGTKANPQGGIELYPSARFFTITGNQFAECAGAVGTFDADGITALYARLAAPETAARKVYARALGEMPANVGDKAERCWKYLLRCPDAVSGSGGHNATLKAACECVKFDLSESEAFDVMRRWSEFKSGGEPWTDREIAHKLKSAEKHAGGERGKRLREVRPSLTRTSNRIVVPRSRDGRAA